ncbi:MAG: CRISPR-associated endonuclease Cas2 [Candidatus Margulisiibacteriota bacterium]|nr:MAG: CRISPR-associated endonuclease Cas2 [Candidatus Margulisbacteria bacterium GWD2_39_127]OGI05134.1 MAG: CRISPR-associated endonuclease Cas2 [Candidatus Margulisbacteria bacterium GWF2_38_17]OGI11173.1 MAG: CRISPR-associated endonuclease Cas2 [Candidatus Margulisbacteria bacterium GWE2_39_32]PZM83940.1 MAG: CRISPR-associated endonuclease Cas2 [Candidatus Margulisiibacteriota bacterium]HAR64166.1 CRISPR-associated endonuclease Cas2 [Candidatus Margulisiibacteriota bacterium]
MFVIVTFDIVQAPTRREMGRRIYRVAKVMKAFGHRVQKSVFECHLDNPQIETLKMRIMMEINIELGDNVRFYKVCNSCFEKIEVLGMEGVTEDQEVYIF